VELGRFYAARFRSGVLFAVFERTKDRHALEESIVLYKSSRTTWAKLSHLADGVYMKDITVGEQQYQRGHWLDRLPAMDKDIALVEGLVTDAATSTDTAPAIEAARIKPVRRPNAAQHLPAESFQAGLPLSISLRVEGAAGVVLYYRHVNQAERYQAATMANNHGVYELEISSSYTNTVYPLQYYFQIRYEDGDATLHPGFDELRQWPPYFVVRRS